MVNQKYLELINKDIDNTISIAEKELLSIYLKTNPEAYAMHQELIETEKLLDKLPDNDPSVSLKRRILNSIDYNRYASKKRIPVVDFILSAFSGPRKRLTTSFAFGLAAGLIILSVIFYVSYYNNFKEQNTVFGTMGLPESEVLKSVEVNSMDITGKIEISKAANHFGVYVNLKSSRKYTLQIEFDQANLKVDDLSLTKLSNIQVKKEPGSIKLIESDNSPYSLLFSAREVYPHKFLLRILRDDKRLFEREILLSKR